MQHAKRTNPGPISAGEEKREDNRGEYLLLFPFSALCQGVALAAFVVRVTPTIPQLPEINPSCTHIGALQRHVGSTEKAWAQALAAVRLGRQQIHVEALAHPARTRLRIMHPQHTTRQHARV
jgi:hypothetical protein